MHRQPYKGCPFECNLAEITWNETVWRMRTNNVKRVYWPELIFNCLLGFCYFLQILLHKISRLENWRLRNPDFNAQKRKKLFIDLLIVYKTQKYSDAASYRSVGIDTRIPFTCKSSAILKE